MIISGPIQLVTNRFNTGGSIYEHQVAEILRKYVTVNLIELDPCLPEWLKSRKLRNMFQISRLQEKSDQLLITNMAAVRAGILRKNFARKVVILHHLDVSQSRHKWVSKTFENLANKALQNAHWIVTVAEFWKQYLSNYIPEEKIVVIENSFRTEAINQVISDFDKDEFKQKMGFPSDKIIVYGGNSQRCKGTVLLMEILNNSDFHVVTSGKRDIDCGTQHLELGYPDYLKLLATADVSVLLSQLKEGWNRCAHESLLCGTPVIGTDQGGLGELLRKAGQTLFRDGHDLHSQIINTVSSRKIIETGRKFAAQFDMEIFSKRWRNLILQET